MSDRIFISYSREDEQFVGRLVEDLTAGGADTWLDTNDIPAGERWDKAIHAALRDCAYFLIVLSPNSVESDSVLDEITYAVNEKKRIFPVFAIDCEIPYRLLRVQYVDFRFGYDQGLKNLLKELARAGLVEEVETQPRPEPEAPPAEGFQDTATTPRMSIDVHALQALKKDGKPQPRYLPFLSLIRADTGPQEAYRQGIILNGLVFRYGELGTGAFSVSNASLLVSEVPIKGVRDLAYLLEQLIYAARDELIIVAPEISREAALELASSKVRTTAIFIGAVGRYMSKVLADLAIVTGGQVITSRRQGTLSWTADRGLMVMESSPESTLSDINIEDVGHGVEISSSGLRVAFRAESLADKSLYLARRDQLLHEVETSPYHVDQVFAMDRLARLAGTAGQDISDMNFFNQRLVLAVNKESVDALPPFGPPRFDIPAGGSRETSITIGRGYASPDFVTDPESGSAVQDDCFILLFAGRLTLDRLLPFLEKQAALRRDGLVIIANSADPSLEATLAVNKLRGFMNVLLVTLDPGSGDTRKMFAKTAKGLNATLFDESSDLAAITIDNLGRASHVSAGEYETTITVSSQANR